jgi:hypothetical protein
MAWTIDFNINVRFPDVEQLEAKIMAELDDRLEIIRTDMESLRNRADEAEAFSEHILELVKAQVPDLTDAQKAKMDEIQQLIHETRGRVEDTFTDDPNTPGVSVDPNPVEPTPEGQARRG